MKRSLFTTEFVIFNIVFFLAFINMAVFFHLHQYLLFLNIRGNLSGLIIGAFSLAAVIFQPLLSPLVNVRNARQFLIIGLVVTICSLVSYRWAVSVFPLVIVRIIHGAGFITFVTAMNASIVALIPANRSGQAFGLISVNVLLPSAVIPALLDNLSLGPERFTDILTVAAIIMIPAAIMPAFLPSSRSERRSHGHIGPPKGVLRELQENIKRPGILVLLLTNLLVFLAYTPIFFLLKEYAQGNGIATPGVFFTISTGTMIAVRLLGGRFFDRLNKRIAFLGSLILLSISFGFLSWTTSGFFYVLGFLFGMGFSLYAPLLNSLLFEYSHASKRGLNLNLSMSMLQAGYLIGPTIGTIVLTLVGYQGLFIYCAVMPVAAACLNYFFIPKIQRI
jgi:predicted MFS family arabinose efflux permease